MGITDDSDLTTKLLENAHENATFKFGTGYFNLTQEYLHVILHKSKAKFDLVKKIHVFIGANPFGQLAVLSTKIIFLSTIEKELSWPRGWELA